MVREVDQLRKQRAYMLISSGKIEDGIKEIQSLTNDYNEKIENLHDEIAFQLCEAAIACFRSSNSTAGVDLAKLALAHAGHANRISRVALQAFELWQQQHEKR